ncbi:DUF5665 domain-containing protein [Nereida sp. MMG025]|uniref:DUF5665 domain-containing protein n=1 Tax=Nereida sp. MMG025 TaxID=2909981 RepID=UPI001F257193|nr:DUF5665 domain-containing protein [Nereida sp. MMG025]MCF6444450.1 DUF5665 domain-containing protein [Nereida sp. MMG025]
MDKDLEKLSAELEKLNQHRFVTVHNSILRLLAFQFARGLFFGLGSVLGATVVVSVLVYLLSQIDFIPVLGDLAQQLIDQIQQPE